MIKTQAVLWALAACASALAGGTRHWQHGTQPDFEKGTARKLAIRSDGRMTLAPVFVELYDPSTAYLWAVAEDSKGNVYAGGSGQDSKAKVFRIDAGSGAGKVVAEVPGLAVHAIAIDAQDRVYAATSPDGRVYRISGGGFEEFYDPKSKYIWALAFTSTGDLLIATGEKGEVHRVAPTGQGLVLFRTDEAHARALAVSPAGDIYVGTEPGGLVLRVSRSGEGFVLYQTSKREVTALVVDGKGNLYVAATGSKQATPSPAPAPPAPPPQPAPAPGLALPGRPGPVPQPAPIPSLGATVTGGSEVLRIEADGYPRRLWSHASEIAYAVALDAEGKPLIGTGNKGVIYRLENELVASQLIAATPTQVTALVSGAKGRILAATGNIGKVYQLGPQLEKQGSYESDALDAMSFSYWGRMHWEGDARSGVIQLDTRSGNLDSPQRNWSPWAPIPLNSSGGRIRSPAARFLQYRITLNASPSGESPELWSIQTAYLPKNVAPLAELIEPTPANHRFPLQTLTLTPSQSLTLAALSRSPRPAPSLAASADTPSNSMTYSKGWIGARWLARDENGDALLFKLEIRGRRESSWKLLKDEIRERQHSWDSTAFPDGEYLLRLTVTDAPANPPAQALSAAVESDPFLLDNTPPRVSGLAGSRTGTRAEVRFRAADALNPIARAEYSVNGGEWRVVEPTTRLSDSPEHDYLLALDGAPAGELTVAVRVTDRYDNQVVDKVVLK